MSRPRTAPPTTHTIEQDQLRALRQAVAHRPPPTVTASSIGMDGAVGLDRRESVPIPVDAPLVSVSWSGSPAFPDIEARFDVPGHASGAVHARMHTPNLRLLCAQLGLRQTWGVGPDRQRLNGPAASLDAEGHFYAAAH